ncbi:hypothetical protein J1N35_019019 [Gossypium stocksii]|uniref:DDE Tnp4 domain-containing protein n=1 Tax=Gossypium stocksii TaxID=47602 RepID=A0A9D4A5H6_9ROSI|nr:hypothetical protein J1N35_019019 [Gossypium stocksii]
MPSYSFEKKIMIVVTAMAIHNFIRKHVNRNDADFMEYENINRAYENIINPKGLHDGESDDDDGGGELDNSSGF